MKGNKKKDRKEYFAQYQKNNRQIRITFPNADFSIIEKIATKQGLTPASFVRLATISQAKKLFLFPKELEDEIKQAIRNMRGIGNNINQIAKYTNQQGYSSPSSMEAIFNYLLELEKEIKELRRIMEEGK